MAKRLMLLLVLLAVLVPVAFEESSAEEEENLLVDYGNGGTAWYPIVSSQSLKDVISGTLGAAGVEVTFVAEGDSQHVLSVGGQGPVTVGNGSTPGMQECVWRVYSWNGVSWDPEPRDVDLEYYGGSYALGFYPKDSIFPVSTPDYKDVWTCYRGNSSSDGVSQSYGPNSVAVPLEWYNTYAGAVDCSILYADGLIYHTVSGLYGSVGMDSLAWLFCLDPVNKQVAWSVSYSDSGNIEISTPVIIGDLIVLTSGNWHVYCLDRYTGEAVAELYPSGSSPDMCNLSRSTEYEVMKGDPSVVNDRVHVNAGPTNAVYDSGALYFDASDGVMRCYSVDREEGFKEIWTHVPDSSVRGCFYYYPPYVTEVDGRKVVVSGNYSGRMMCVDALTGEGIWATTIKDSNGNKSGAVTAVAVCSGGRAVVCFADGGMVSSSGGVALVDLRDGSVIWEQDVLCSKPAVSGDRFYSYVSYSSKGAKTLVDHDTGAEVELVSGYCSFWVDDGTLSWIHPTDALSVGGVTYCGSRIYSMDYSPGSEGSLGGWVWCMDADTGDVVWKAKVSPYGGAAYSMCAPTVVDGKVLVGNDYGAIYVISEVHGEERQGSSEISYESQGLAHWSWIALFVALAAFTFVMVRMYRS